VAVFCVNTGSVGMYLCRTGSGIQWKQDGRADAKVQFLDTGHFAIETHVAEIGSAMKDFLNANNRTRV
jgi:surfactin synthase thioesterase subunit